MEEWEEGGEQEGEWEEQEEERESGQAGDGLRSQLGAEPKLWLLCSHKPSQKLGPGLEVESSYFFFIMSFDVAPSGTQRMQIMKGWFAGDQGKTRC